MADDAALRWAAEKRALLATIAEHERRAAGLSRRFKLLQRTVREQQALLDQYQRALQLVGRPPPQVTQNTQGGDAKAAGQQAASVEALIEQPPANEQTQERREEAQDQEESGTCMSPPLVPMLEPVLAAAEAAGSLLPSTVAAPELSKQTAIGETGGQAATVEPPNVAVRSLDVEPAREFLPTDPVESSSPKTPAPVPAQPLSASPPSTTIWTRRRVPELGSKSANTVVVAEKPAVASPSPKKSFSSVKRQRVPQPTWAEIKKQRAVAAAASAVSKPIAAVPIEKPSVVAREKENQGFAFVEVVRNREERAALPAFDCAECARYYAALGDAVSAEQIAEQKQKCSRHRARYQPFETPDDFWRLSFPDSAPTN